MKFQIEKNTFEEQLLIVSRAINNKTTLPVLLIISITITVTKDIKAPTDRSTSPLVSKIVMPKATIITVELERRMLLIF